MKAKKIILVVALAGVIFYMVKRRKDNLEVIQQGNNEIYETDSTEMVNDKYLEVNDRCVLIKYFKQSLNMIRGADLFDSLDTYSTTDRDLLIPIFEDTVNVVNENNGLRKLFLYDFVKTVATAIDSDVEPRPLSYDYTTETGVVTLGDKGTSVQNLQELINKIYVFAYPDEQVTIPVTSTYDKKTAEAALQLFKGTSALLDNEKGTLSKEFINNFNAVLRNLNVYKLNMSF